MIRHRHPVRHFIAKTVRRFGELCGGFLIIGVVAILSVLAPKPR